MNKTILIRRSVIFVVLASFVPLLLTMLVPLGIGYIPVLGTIYIILLQIYVLPLYLFSTIFNIQLFRPDQQDYGVLSWSIGGIILALSFWIITTSIICYFVVRNATTFANTDQDQLEKITALRKNVDKYFKHSVIVFGIFFVVTMCILYFGL